MSMEIKVPDIGDASDVSVIEILVAVGDAVAVDQSLITVESDKASMEIPSTHAGTVTALKVKLGDKVSEDIAYILRTSMSEAEEIKVRYACAMEGLTSNEESIQVMGIGDHPPRRLLRQTLAHAAQKRYEEIFEMVQAELRRSGFEEHVRAGMVLTGGAAKMEGVVELAEEMLQMPVRVGYPQDITGLGGVVNNPVHASGVGLLLMGSQIEHPRRPTLSSGRTGSWFKKVWNRFTGEF